MVAIARDAPRPARIAVYGLYKTGTTALFASIRRALPTPPRTLFEGIEYRPTSGDQDTGVLAKVIAGHNEVDYESFMPFEKKILLVRDPRDWIISGCLFLTKEIEGIYLDHDATSNILAMLEQKENAPRTIPFVTLLEEVISSSSLKTLDVFSDRVRDLLDRLPALEDMIQPCLRLHYEDFIDGKLQTLSRYIGLDIQNDISVEAEFPDVPRTKSYGNWKSWFTQEDIDFFRPIFSSFLEYYGYDSNWELNASPRIPASHGSRYVRNIVERKRRIAIGGAPA